MGNLFSRSFAYAVRRGPEKSMFTMIADKINTPSDERNIQHWANK